MSKDKKRTGPFAWIGSLFMGSDWGTKDDRYDSPGKLAVKRFFHKPLATGAVIVLAGLFLFAFIGSAISPANLTETGSEAMHTNVPPTNSLMKLPESMKADTVDISSRGTFTIGVDKDGKVHMWGHYFNTSGNPAKDVMNIPEEVQNSKIIHVAAGSDHCVAISEEGRVYAWGNDGLAATNLSSVIKHGKKEGKLEKLAFTNDGIYGIDEHGAFVYGKSTKFNTISTTDENGKVTTFDLIEYIGERKVEDIAATGNAIALVLDDGEIVVSGMKDPLPTLEEGEEAVSVSGGTRHFAMVTDKGRAYAWGQNFRDQCNVPKELQQEGAVDQVISSGFQNYAFKNGQYVGAWGLKGYLMGTDDMGRDLFNRIMNGGRMTMTIGAVAVIISTILGVVIGCISGYFGGKVDMLLMRIAEIFGSIPFLPFALCLSAIFQSSDLQENTRIFIIMIILGVLSWTGLARLVRGQILAEREKEFVTAARSMGIKETRIAFRHILPNIVTVILVNVTLSFARCMLTESSLSYLGFGVQLPRPTWGNMLNGCLNAIVIQNYWWRWLFPSIFLSLAVICINIIGDTLRDVLDPKSEVEK